MKLWTALFLLIASLLSASKWDEELQLKPCKSGPNVYGEYLFFQATVTPIFQTAKVMDFDAENFIIGSAKAINLDFPWNSAFRVGAGFNLGKSKWFVDGSWVKFREETVNTVTSPNPDLLFTPNEFYFPREGDFLVSTFSRGCWKLKFDSIDFSIGREFYLGNNFTIWPQMGLKSIWNKQNLDLDVRNVFVKFDFLDELIPFATSGMVMAMGRFWGIGPTLDFSLKWDWFYNLGLSGKLKGGFLWGKYKDQVLDFQADIDLSETIPVFPPFSFDAPSTFNIGSRIKPFVEMQIGLDWVHCFQRRKAFTELFVGFEMQHYWKQNLVDFASYLNLKGLVVSGMLGF